MSKAFPRESDDAPERPIVSAPRSALPPGTKNYLTPDGAERLRKELESLVQVERSRIAALPDAEEARRLLHSLDQRVIQIKQTLASAVVVPAPSTPEDRVRFGATITVRELDGISRYRIVGVDETDPERGWISWLSPIAKAVMNARVGERVRLKLPTGEQELEILSITYRLEKSG